MQIVSPNRILTFTEYAEGNHLSTVRLYQLATRKSEDQKVVNTITSHRYGRLFLGEKSYLNLLKK